MNVHSTPPLRPPLPVYCWFLSATCSCCFLFCPTLTKAEDKSLWDKSTKVKEKLKFNLFTLLRTEAEATFWNLQKTFHTSTGKNNPGNVYLKKKWKKGGNKNCISSLTCSFVQVPGRLSGHVYLKTRTSVSCVYTGAVFRFALSNMAGM